MSEELKYCIHCEKNYFEPEKVHLKKNKTCKILSIKFKQYLDSNITLDLFEKFINNVLNKHLTPLDILKNFNEKLINILHKYILLKDGKYLFGVVSQNQSKICYRKKSDPSVIKYDSNLENISKIYFSVINKKLIEYNEKYQDIMKCVNLIKYIEKNGINNTDC